MELSSDLALLAPSSMDNCFSVSTRATYPYRSAPKYSTKILGALAAGSPSDDAEILKLFPCRATTSRLMFHESALAKILLMLSYFSKLLQIKIPIRASLPNNSNMSNQLTLIF